MIRWLYDVEDRLFYASLMVSKKSSKRMQTWSLQIGQLADRLGALPVLHTRR
jgi:hypothetical protein